MAEPVVASGGAPEGRQHAGSFPKGNTFGTAHRFRPGQSGNPGGTSNYIEHTRAMALRAVPEAMQLLIRIAGDPKADLSYRIRCAETILDRVLGKPAQSVNILAAVADVDLASMSDLELLAHVTRLRAAAELPSRELPECSAPFGSPTQNRQYPCGSLSRLRITSPRRRANGRRASIRSPRACQTPRGGYR